MTNHPSQACSLCRKTMVVIRVVGGTPYYVCLKCDGRDGI